MTYGPNETRKLAMKVEVNSQALADAVAWTTRVIDARPASPILAGIRLEAIDGTLQLSAFNYAISARHHIEAGVDESGSILVLGKLLADITKSLPAAKTYLSTDGSTLTITSGKSAFTSQELTLTAGSVDEAQAKEILDIDMDGEDITVAFNPAYLIEGLSAISEPFVRMKMTTAVKPVEFNGQQESNSEESMDYRYLLVPMRFNS